MDGYFDEFKGKKKKNIRIHKSVVDEYYDDIYLMVDTNYTYAQVVLPRVAWLRPMKYEVHVDEICAIGTTFLFE